MPTIDKTGIQTGQTIEAAQILGIIEALDGTNSSDIIINGKLNVDNNVTITGSMSTTANANISGFITVGDSNLRLRESPASFGLPPTGILQSDSRFRVADDLEASNISGSTVTLMIESGSSVQNFGVSGAYQVSWNVGVTQNFFEDDFIRLNWDSSGQYSLAIMTDPSNGQVNIINNEEGTYTHFNANAASGGVFISEIVENSSNSTTIKAPEGGTSFPFYKILIVHSDSATYSTANMYAIIEKLIN